MLVEGVMSSWSDVISGVPQGTVLGPLLFLLFINDLPSVVAPDTTCRLFANDCLLYREIHSQDDQLQLQRDLKSLEDWNIFWGMNFNAKKCNIRPMSSLTVKPPANAYIQWTIQCLARSAVVLT